jgi:class 3 adenylate cyclase/predicted ATPase
VDVGSWLRNLGLEQYEAAFRENDVSADVLCHLTAEDLEGLGVAAIGHRRRLLVAIAKLREDAASLQAVKSIGDRPASAPAAERRQITVLFCDIVGSTPLSTGLDPEELREILTAYQANVAAAVTGRDGYVARFVGDGVLAYFGWPNPDEAHAESAVRAGLAIIEAVGPQRLPVRIGIATGLVVTGDLVGVGAAQTMTAVGETPNLAARLQGLAQPDTIVVSDATRSQLGQMFELEDLGLHALKGFDTPVRPWRVLGKTEAVSRSEVVYASTLAPLVGRDEELGQLLRRWHEAKAGEGRIVLLSGEAGIGKSRLLAALEERLTGEPHINLRYFCSPHHQDSPLYPITARLEREAGFIRGDPAVDRLAKLETVLAPTEPPAEDITLLAALLSIPTEGRYPVLELSPQQRRKRTFMALLRRLTGLAREQPVLLLFEDAHWSDPTSIELLDAVIEQVPDLPVLLVVSFRPEFVAPWFGRPRVSLMALNRLDRRDAATLAAQVVTNHILSSQLLDRIVMQSDGVPLFIEELTRAVLEARELGTAGATLAVPNTLQASLMARLDRLPAAKTVAQIGSVIGREFPHTLLEAAATGLQDTQLTEGLNELAAAGLLFRRGAPPDAVYMFKHALVRDVAYASLLKAPRQQLHRVIGEALRDEFPERGETEPEIVAYHFAQAGLQEAGVEWWGKAGNLALQRSAHREAIAHLENALELSRELGDSPERQLSRLRLQIIYGNALRTVHGLGAPETMAAFERAYNTVRTIGDVPERFAALHGLWSVRFQHGNLTAMRELARTFLHDVEGRPELPEMGVAHRVGGTTSFLAGDFIDARRHLERALACYDSERDARLVFRYGVDLAVPAMAYLALTLWKLGIGDDARCLIEKTVSHAVRTKHIATAAQAYVLAILFAMLRRDRVRSGPYAWALLDLARDHGLLFWRPYSGFCEGWLRCQAGDSAEGLAQMYDSLRPLREQSGYHPGLPMAGVLIAETEAEAGNQDAALGTIDAELARMTETGLCGHLAEALRVRGEVLLRFKPAEVEAAEAAFMRAIEVARGQSAKRFELRAATRLKQLWAAQGKLPEHRGLLAILAEGLADGSDWDGFAETAARPGNRAG